MRLITLAASLAASLFGAPATPTRAEVAREALRAGQGPLINEAQVTADAALSLIPIGAVMDYPCAEPPSDPRWTLEDGKMLSMVEYPDLYVAMGTIHNRGDEPEGYFRISDSRARVRVGAGQATGLSNRVVGEEFGQEKVVLSTSEMPSHNHSGSTGSSSHSHDDTYTSYSYSSVQSGAGASVMDSGFYTTDQTSTEAHSHSLSISSAGSDFSHDNMPPALVAWRILRVL